jgi:RNA polymerase sigma-70 factor (ECF subfamily)
VPFVPLPDFEGTLAAAQARDEQALRLLFVTHQPRLLRLLRALEPRAAEDLAGDVWLAVARHLPAFEGDEADFRAWLFTIARNRLADHRRRASRRPVIVPLAAGEEPVTADAADDLVERSSADEAVAQICALLPSDQAEVVLLRVVAGLAVEDVAELTGRSPGSVRVIQHRALKRLARLLQARVVTR